MVSPPRKFSAAYGVEVLPLPVGPATRIMPWGTLEQLLERGHDFRFDASRFVCLPWMETLRRFQRDGQVYTRRNPATEVTASGPEVRGAEARIREVVPGARCYIEAESLKVPRHGEVGKPS